MEFELEDLEDNQGPTIDLEKEREPKQTLGEKEKRINQARRNKLSLWQNFRKFSKNYMSYKLILLPIFLIIFTFIIPKFFEYAKRGYLNLVKGQQKVFNVPTSINNSQTPNVFHSPKSTPNSIPKKSIQTHKIDEGQVIYSWIDENGHKSYSNIGFPKDKKYTEGKLEWY